MVIVSTVIVTYKRPDKLNNAINTVKNQTFKDMEILVVDGANSEQNKIVVDLHSRYDNRIKYVPVEEEAVDMYSLFGMQHSRNVGCKIAKGKYIAMLDDDDEWESTKIEKQVMILEENEQLNILVEKEIGLVICYNKIKLGKTEIIDKPKLEPTYEDLLQSFNFSSTSTFMIKKSALEEIGWWNEELRGMHEYDIALKLSKAGYHIYTYPEVLMTRNRFSDTASSDFFVKIAEVFDFWKYYGKDVIENIGFEGFFFNICKTFGLFVFFSLGYVFKQRVWNSIYSFKGLMQPRD